ALGVTDVLVVTPVEFVVAGFSLKDVGARSAREFIVALAGVNVVVGGTANDGVVTTARPHHLDVDYRIAFALFTALGVTRARGSASFECFGLTQLDEEVFAAQSITHIVEPCPAVNYIPTVGLRLFFEVVVAVVSVDHVIAAAPHDHAVEAPGVESFATRTTPHALGQVDALDAQHAARVEVEQSEIQTSNLAPLVVPRPQTDA